MAYLDDHKAKFDNLSVNLESKNIYQLKRTANGGNSIVFTYPPEEELLYLKKINEIALENNFELINISKLLVEIIDSEGWNEFKSYYNDFKDTPHLVFKSDDESVDLMDLIISNIKRADDNGKIPVLIKTGALFGTGIENVNIMEDKSVMGLNNPLIIFYPGKIENENLYFLNSKLASKYRCTVIE
jgi:hypothetical protein